MVVEESWRNSRRVELIALVVNSVLPLVGIIALGWNAAALLLLYWLEFGSTTLWALFRALLAGRPSELEYDTDRGPVIFGGLASKQTPIEIPYSTLRIYPSSIPVVCFVGPLLGFLWVLVGSVTITTSGTENLSPAAGSAVMICAAGVFVSHGIATAIGYIDTGTYRDHSAQTVTQSVLKRLVVTFLVVLGMLPFAYEIFSGGLGPGLPILVAIVLLKLGFDLAGHYDERLAAFDRRNGGIFGWAGEPPEPDSIEPLPEVSARLGPTRRQLAAYGLINASREPTTPAIVLFGLLFGYASLSSGSQLVGVGFLAAAVGLPVVLSMIDTAIRYGWMEYQLTDSAIVGYDRLLGGPQWRVDAWDERGLRVETTWIDRWLGTETVVVELAETEHRIPLLAEPEAVLEPFGRRPTRPDN